MKTQLQRTEGSEGCVAVRPAATGKRTRLARRVVPRLASRSLGRPVKRRYP